MTPDLPLHCGTCTRIWSLSLDLLYSHSLLVCTMLGKAVPYMSHCQLGSVSPVPHSILLLSNEAGGVQAAACAEYR